MFVLNRTVNSIRYYFAQLLITFSIQPFPTCVSLFFDKTVINSTTASTTRLDLGWIQEDPTTFLKKVSFVEPVRGNDQTLLKNVFGRKIG